MTGTSGCSTRAIPTSGPPGSTESSPFGSPACSSTEARKEAASDCRAKVRLEYDRVPERERRCHRPHREHAGKLNGENDTDHTDGHPLRKAQSWPGGPQYLGLSEQERARGEVRFGCD
jgi:hypothetical protein